MHYIVHYASEELRDPPRRHIPDLLMPIYDCTLLVVEKMRMLPGQWWDAWAPSAQRGTWIVFLYVSASAEDI